MCTVGDHQRRIRSEFDEITNLSVIHQLKENLRNYKFCISTHHGRIATDESFMKKFVTEIYKLEVQQMKAGFRINSDDVQRIKNVLSRSNIKVCFFMFFYLDSAFLIKIDCCLIAKQTKV